MMAYFKPKLVAYWLDGPVTVWLCVIGYVKSSYTSLAYS